MSKQEKLAAFLEEFSRWHVSNHSQKHVLKAWEQYQAAPDDPPPRPEMPECVAKMYAEFSSLSANPYLAKIAKAVRDYYAQPLKLEVGKVYADEKTFLVDVVWHNQMFEDHFVGVRREGGLPYIYSSCGVCMSDGGENLIREVTK